MKTKRCYLYTRVSTAIQVDGFSLEAQREKLRKYAEFQETAEKVLDSADILRFKLLDCADNDMAAFNGVMEALHLPKGSDEEKAKRSEALQKAYKAAILAPLETKLLAVTLGKLHGAVCERSLVFRRGNVEEINRVSHFRGSQGREWRHGAAKDSLRVKVHVTNSPLK